MKQNKYKPSKYGHGPYILKSVATMDQCSSDMFLSCSTKWGGETSLQSQSCSPLSLMVSGVCFLQYKEITMGSSVFLKHVKQDSEDNS